MDLVKAKVNFDHLLWKHFEAMQAKVMLKLKAFTIKNIP